MTELIDRYDTYVNKLFLEAEKRGLKEVLGSLYWYAAFGGGSEEVYDDIAYYEEELKKYE